MRVVWTRGKGCADLAAAVSDDTAARVTGDIEQAVVAQRADLLVTKKFTPKAFVSTASPMDFDLDAFDRVVAMVGGGPHSALATDVANRIGQARGVPARLISAYREPEERPDAVATIYRLNEVAPGIDADVVEATSPADLITRIGDRTLIVLGAPGGSWVQRMFIGPGARLISAASAGAVVVRRAARRVYQVMEDPIWVSPLLGATDAVRLSNAQVLPVVDRGRLVGTTARSTLLSAAGGETVGALMRPPEAVKITDGVRMAGDVASRQGGGPVAVVDDDGHLVGTVPLSAIRSSAAY